MQVGAYIVGMSWRDRWAQALSGATAKDQGLPWGWARDDGLYAPKGRGDPWLYTVLPTMPLQWADQHQRIATGQQIGALLRDIGLTSRLPMGANMPKLSVNRQIHLITISMDVPPEVPGISTAHHREFIQDVFDMLDWVPIKLFMLGVRLMPVQVVSQLEEEDRSLTGDQLLELGRVLFRVPSADFGLYQQDLDQIKSVVFKYGGKPPDSRQRLLLESWYNRGEGNGVLIRARPTWLEIIDTEERIEMAQVSRFERVRVQSSEHTWAAAAASHNSGAMCVSIRGELEPAAAFAKRLHSSRRRQSANIDEAAKGDPLMDEAEFDKLALQADAESMVKQEGEPVVINASVVMARVANHQVSETYIDMLNNRFGIVARPHWNRQVSALRECLPCFTGERSTTQHAMNIKQLAFAGLGSFGQLGDEGGIYLGRSDPDWSICWLDPWAAAAGSSASQAPGVAVLGQPGSGKTFAMQLMALQSALLGRTVIYINPKPQDDLSGIVDLVGRWAPSRLIQLGDAAAEPGAFDPFRFAPPEYAYQIASLFIQDVFASTFNDYQQVQLEQALRQATQAGVRSVGEAIQQFVQDQQMRDLILSFAESNPIFAMGIGNKPGRSLQAERGLTMIQFDQAWPDVEPGKAASDIPLSDRAFLAVMRLVPRAALELLLRDRMGGDLYMDEAHRLLSSQAGQKFVERQGREGRSQGVMPVLGTHLPSEISNTGLDTFMGRYLILMLQDRDEAAIGLELAGMEATDQRIDILGMCGPQAPQNGRPALPARGIHRDLQQRSGGIAIAPIPEWIRQQLSTSTGDVQARQSTQRQAVPI